MAKFTFLEVHLDGAEFQANAPFSTGENDGEADDAETDTESSGVPRLLVAFVVLALVATVAVAAKKFLGGSGDSDESDLDDLDIEQ